MAPLEPLSDKAHDWAVRSYINQGLQAGQSVTSLYEASKGTEWAMRKTDFLAIGRELKGIERARSVIASTPNKYLLGEASHVDAKWPIRDSYRYTVKTMMEDPKTGGQKPWFTYISSPERMTKDEITEEAEAQAASATEDCEANFGRFQILTALRMSG